MGEILTTALGIGTSLAEGAANQIFGEMNQARELRGQKKALANQNNAAMDLWNRTNYKAQMQQMREAGLNPGMMYGMGGAGGTTGAGSATAKGEQGNVSAAAGIQTILGIKSNEANIELMKSQAELNRAEAENKRGIERDMANVTIGNVLQGTELLKQQVKTEEGKQALNKIDYDLKTIQYKFENATYEDRVQMMKDSANTIGENLKIVSNQRKISDATLNTQIAQYGAYLAKTWAEVAKAKMDVKVGEQGIKESEARIKNMTEQMLVLQWQTQINGWNAETNEKMYELQEKIQDLPESEKATLMMWNTMDPLKRTWEDWKGNNPQQAQRKKTTKKGK